MILMTSRTSNFQKKCDLLSHYAAVSLAFIVPISTTGTNIVLPVLVLLWFLAGSLQEKVKLIFENPVTKVILSFFALYIVGSLYSVGPIEDRLALLSKMSKLLYIPFLLPMFREAKWRQAAYVSFIFSILFTLVLSFCKYYEWVPLPLGLRHTSACVFKDHIDTNLLMAFSSFLLVHYAVRQNADNWVRYGLLCLVLLLTFYVGFMSEGRSGQVIFIALLFTFFLQHFHWKGLLYGVIGFSLLGSVVFMHSHNFQKRWVPQEVTDTRWQPDPSIGQRREFFKETLALANQHPWFGFGTGSFKTVYRAHTEANQLEKTNNPHGEYLNIYFQLGLMGLVGSIGFFLMLLKISFQLPSLERIFAQGLLVAIGVGCLANSWLMDFTAGHFFVLFAALCFGAWQKVKGN